MERKLSTCGAPRARGDILWVDKLKGGEEGKYLICSNKVYGFFSHWTGQRTVPCWENHDLCEGGHNENTLRENYFLQCWSMQKNKGVFLYLTPEARNQFYAQVETTKSFNGLTIVVKRTGAKNGRLNVELAQYVEPKILRVKELDPYLSVLTFMRVPKQLIDQARSLGSIPDIDIMVG